MLEHCSASMQIIQWLSVPLTHSPQKNEIERDKIFFKGAPCSLRACYGMVFKSWIGAV